MKTSTTLDEQIELLKQRGMIINDIKKAKEILLDIGYYRLGFYWFPFEKSYPQKKNRNHNFNIGCKIEDIVQLYYFDQDLRNIISPYLFRIEIDFRTFLTYTISNHYKDSPTWFADTKIINTQYLNNLDKYYETIKKNNQVIKAHHKKYINDKYAPAWKTLEFMSFGNIIMLYSNIKNTLLQQQISQHYEINNIKKFKEYLRAICILRNKCAHGRNIYDMKLSKSLKKDTITNITEENLNNINGVLNIVFFILSKISTNREKELKEKLHSLIKENSNLKDIIKPLWDL